MKKNFLIQSISLVLMAAVLLSCKKENSDFAGSDNHIISFELTVSGVTYPGSITNDQIIVSVPEGLSVRNAAVEVVISENSTISPKPSEIADWSADEQFVVTSYNNERKSYIYKLQRTTVTTSGNVLLSTQAEVDAFAETGVTIIDGNLTIGKTIGSAAADTIRNLSGLSGLRQVVHNLTLNNTYAGNDLAGIKATEKIGGLRIGNVASISEIELPLLKSVGTSLSIASVTAEKISFPELTFIGESFTVKSDSLLAANFDQLSFVGADMTFNGSNGTSMNNNMQTISFPKLESVGGALSMTFWPRVETANLPLLKTVGGTLTLTQWSTIDVITFPVLENTEGLTFSNLASVAELDVPKLERIVGNVAFSGMGSMRSLFMNALTQINGNLTLNLAAASGVIFPELTMVSGTLSIPSGAANLVAPYFPKLSYIGEELSIQSSGLTDLTGFAALEEIGKRLYLYGASSLTSLSDLSSLKKIGTVCYLSGLTALTELDVRGIEIPEIDIFGTTWTGLKIIGDDDFKGYLYLSSAPSGLSILPEIEGFKRIDRLSISSGSFTGALEFDNFEEVTGLLDLTSCNSAQIIRLSNLRKAGGIQFNYNNSLSVIDFPELEEITGYISNGNESGNFNYPVSSNISEVNLPKLKKIKGNFNLTGLTAARTNLKAINMPMIETITGNITITGNNNSTFTSVNNFSNLNSAGGVTISNFSNLNSFKGFLNVIPFLDGDSWKISGCGHNPSYEEMVEGLHTKQ